MKKISYTDIGIGLGWIVVVFASFGKYNNIFWLIAGIGILLLTILFIIGFIKKERLAVVGIISYPLGSIFLIYKGLEGLGVF